MTNQEIISHFSDCRRHLVDLRGRQDYSPLTCAILRLEGAGGIVLYDQPFARILGGRPFHDCLTINHGETFAIAFYSVADGTQADRIPVALATVEAITREVHPLLLELRKPVRELLQLPDGDSWWRIVFHLAWHFPRPFLKATRRRLLSKDGAPAGISDETFVHLYGMAGRSDLLPGLIYSALEHDLCTCSEAAISVILDALGKQDQACTPAGLDAPALSAEYRRTFDRLRAEFEAGAQMPMALECQLLKLADSFESPPATEWAGLKVGGCVERFLTLSKLNDQQEIVQIRGSATEWFCHAAERAGNALPTWIPDRPIMFDDCQRGFGGPRPVMNRDTCERWIGFVFSTIKQHVPESLRVTWGTSKGPLSYGFATLNQDLSAASVLAIDLARLTTTAAEAAKRNLATCSPFTVPSMEEQGFEWAEVTPPPTPQASYTLGQLVEDLRRFAEDYHRAADRIREENPITAKHSRIQLAAHVSGARACLLAIPGFTELREWVQYEWKKEIGFVAGQRIVDTLNELSHGSLSTSAIEGLTLAETAALLRAPAEQWESVLPDRPREEYAARQDRLRSEILAAHKHGRLHVEDIDNFAKVRNVHPNTVARFLQDGYLDQSEDAIQKALESILGVAFHKKDWGGESNDLYTPNVLVNGLRTPTAFLLKGNGLKTRTMEVKHCGKNGDQVMRLFQSPAALFVIQFVGNISEALIHHAEGEVARLKLAGREAYFVILDGQDTARLMHAYGKL